MTRILDRLARKDCIERRENPEDRRSSLVFLTRAGERLLDEVISHLADCNTIITAGIEPEHMEKMRAGLHKICANVSNIAKEDKK